MNISDNFSNQKIWEKLVSLKKSSDKAKKAALQKRISRQPQITDMEYLWGAFIEMYEPHLKEMVHKLSQKGYLIDPASGFGGKNAEFQAMVGDFSVDYVTKNKLEKIGVKFRELNGTKSLIFWPEKATLDDIKTKWLQIISTLPDKGVLAAPSAKNNAIMFRRKYIPRGSRLQKQRLFEKLEFRTQRKVETDIKRRKAGNPHPNKLESILGLWVEELEPQVRQAVLLLNKKGYSTDVSGFMDNPCDQMIEGDFQLDGKTMKSLQSIGVQIETNPSGYTRLQFSPEEADIQKIKRRWDKIASLFPDRKQHASSSMTRKAREFRVENR